MKNKTFIAILLLLSFNKLNGQIFSESPRNINHAVEILDENLHQKTKNKIVNTASDSLLFLHKNSRDDFEIMRDWFFKLNRKSIYKDTRLGKYYEKKGLKIPNDMIEVVLITYQRKLKGLSINHEETLKPFKIRQLKYDQEDKIRLTSDSLRGIYIPEDLNDCFRTLDEIYSDSIKIEITKMTESDYSSGNHLFGIGIWMRNNWQLWGGSRLSKYFSQIGIYHPDDMSGIIMTSYHRYLNNEEILLDQQVKYYQDYWKRSKKEHGG